MSKIRIENGAKMEKILKAVGPTGATIKKAGEWDLSVFITKRNKKSMIIEMCECEHFGGDLILDPFMEIYLKTDEEGHITQAIPRAYQSDNLYVGRTEINEKGEIFLNRELTETKRGELDRRLESWLCTIDAIGYLTSSDEIIFHDNKENNKENEEEHG